MDLQAVQGRQFPSASRGTSSSSSSHLSAARYTEQQSTSVQIVTAEGDRVTISRNSSVDASYGSYTRTGASRGNGQGYSSVSAETMSLSASSSYSMSVDGDLSEEELADIQKALSQSEEMMEDLVAGDIAGVLEHAQEFQDLDSLSSLEASRQVTATYSAVDIMEQTSERVKGQGRRPLPGSEVEQNVLTEQVDPEAETVDLFGSMNDWISKLLESYEGLAFGREGQGAESSNSILQTAA